MVLLPEPEDLLRGVWEEIEALRAQLALVPRFTWATVTSADPLRIRLDGDADELPGKPASAVAGLLVDERVLCLLQDRRVTVVSAAGRP